MYLYVTNTLLLLNAQNIPKIMVDVKDSNEVIC